MGLWLHFITSLRTFITTKWISNSPAPQLNFFLPKVESIEINLCALIQEKFGNSKYLESKIQYSSALLRLKFTNLNLLTSIRERFGVHLKLISLLHSLIQWSNIICPPLTKNIENGNLLLFEMVTLEKIQTQLLQWKKLVWKLDYNYFSAELLIPRKPQ